MAESGLHMVRMRYFQRANYNLTLCGVFLPLDVLAVILRVYSRRKQKLRLQLDDWLMFPALILIVGSTATIIHSIRQHAMGYPVSTTQSDLATSTEAIQNTNKAEFIIGILLVPALTFVKLSILAFYKRIFCVHDTSRIRYIINCLIVVVALWGIAFFFVRVFVCGTSYSAYWTSFETLKTKCMETGKMENAYAITDFVIDVALLVLPLVPLWQLRLRTSRKLAVSLVFLVGSGAVVSSAVRLGFAVYFVNKGIGASGEDGDLVVTGMMSWLQLEAFLGLLAACLPTIRFLFKGLSLELVIDSIRSVLSLHSLHSHHSRLSDERTRGTESQRDLANGAQAVNMDERVTDKGDVSDASAC